ncbi:folylpolyglutamate synthase [Listeria cornellensis FSL F6-0969]|uniref:Folylpolyglutamate synthase n=1 Tax=Listeria cornellensis FSL F6-0969 TaxID=1265820 RepID=W7C1E6_9LIST|nr:folylpolyglutamate synthase [Listeria cornellensis FSL F6-0969]
MISLLNDIENVQIYITTFDYPRALTKNDIKQIAITNNITSVENWENILNSWMESEEEEVILITGSLYFISEVRKTLLNS